MRCPGCSRKEFQGSADELNAGFLEKLINPAEKNLFATEPLHRARPQAVQDGSQRIRIAGRSQDLSP